MSDSPESDGRPLLSLVMTGRNDAYMGDFKWRLATALNILGRSAFAIGRQRDVEVIVADWNSEVPLHTEIPLVQQARAITRFIPVPAPVAVPVQKDTTFPDSIVINTGIRRARGEFVAQTGSDIVFTPASLNAMLAVLGGAIPNLPIRKAFFTGARRHIPVAQVMRRHRLAALEAYIDRNAAFFPPEPGGPGHAAPTNMMLMHRDLWHECHGFDERFIYWGFNDIDLTLRMTQRYPFIHLDHFGVNLLHLEHWTKQREYKSETMFRKMNPADNLTPPYTVNGDDWGLGGHDLPSMRAEKGAPDDTPPPPGSVEGWNLPLSQIAAEVTSAEIQNVVRTHMQPFGQMPIRPTEGAALMCLVWYSTRKHPRGYVEVGFRYPHAAGLVTKHSPGAEVYAAVSWERRKEDDPIFYTRDDTSLIFHVSNSFRQFGHWAYTQYVGGDPATAVRRLIDSAMGPFNIDLALIRADRDDAPAQALEVADHLTPGGAIVVTAPTAARYQAVVDAIRAKYTLFALLNFGDGVNGMVIAARPTMS